MASHSEVRRFQRTSSYALLIEEGKILLCRLVNQDPGKRAWTLPGGGIDFGEHPTQTVKREVREETGLEVEVGEFLGFDSIVFPFTHCHMHNIRFVYKATITGGELVYETEGTTDRCEWFPLEAVKSLLTVDLVGSALNMLAESQA